MAGDSTTGSNDSTSSIESRKASREKLERWLNKSMRIKMTDGRTLVGTFVCTDCDCNIIMGSCEEYLKPPDSEPREDPRILGLAMVPGKHIVSIEIDDTSTAEEEECDGTAKNESRNSVVHTPVSEQSTSLESGADVV
ncbi:unnamed protein product [Candidula unifasciata]|uniref:Sm domain-containing protein n=1 Tax=Candidula unifasciata TaxID=100452 RepID=A0A8S3YL08_9EUPU|nr:unnamed protein product [Candidula unifasciata]